jgi:flagellar basal body L-ring protein FlgH
VAQSPYPQSSVSLSGTSFPNGSQTYNKRTVPNYEEGSLWGEGSRFNTPFDEIPAPEFQIGDIVVVQVKENFRSQEDIRYENNTESEIKFDVAGVWKNSTDKSLFGKLGSAIDYPQTDIEGTDDYQGETRGNRRSQLILEIPCTVTKILPDGRLMIEGRQARIIGRDKKNRILSGTIRPEDVDPVTRTIASTRIADSQLRWEGKGPGENVTNPGFIHRILDYIPIF